MLTVGNMAVCRYKVYELFVAVRKLDLQFSTIMLLTGFIFFQFTTEERAFLIPNVIVFCIEVAWERYAACGDGDGSVVWVVCVYLTLSCRRDTSFGFLGIRRENRQHMWVFFALSAWLPIFVTIIGLLTVSSFDLFDEILVRSPGCCGRTTGLTCVLRVVCGVPTTSRIARVPTSWPSPPLPWY